MSLSAALSASYFQLEEELRQKIEEEVRRRMVKFKDIEKEHAAQLAAADAAARAAETARDEASGRLFEAQEVRLWDRLSNFSFSGLCIASCSGAEGLRLTPGSRWWPANRLRAQRLPRRRGRWRRSRLSSRL